MSVYLLNYLFIDIRLLVLLVKSQHGHTAWMKRSLKSSPDVVTIGLIWDSARPDETLVTSAMQSVDCSLHISCVSPVMYTAAASDIQIAEKQSKVKKMWICTAHRREAPLMRCGFP